MSLYSTGRTTGQICDSGEGKTDILSVYDGYPLRASYRRGKITGALLTSFLQKHLIEDGINLKEDE